VSNAQNHAGESVIHDLGYRRYDGPRLGRGAIVRALIWHSFRSSWGIGRGLKAKIVPVLAFIVMCLPALVNAGVVANGGNRLFDYDTYVIAMRPLLLTVFLAAQAPELISRDLRSGVLPLYFSRPIRSGDYPLAKYIALAASTLILVEVPLLILYLGTIVSAKNGHGVWVETRALIPGLGIGVLWAVLPVAIATVLASLAARRAYATGIIAIAFVLTFTLAGLLISVGSSKSPVNTTVHVGGMLSPYTIIDGVRIWLGGNHDALLPAAHIGGFGPLYGALALLLLTASLGGLAVRYRKVSQS
jgi:ABC-2 type transport system permease protein